MGVPHPAPDQRSLMPPRQTLLVAGIFRALFCLTIHAQAIYDETNYRGTKLRQEGPNCDGLWRPCIFQTQSGLPKTDLTG